MSRALVLAILVVALAAGSAQGATLTLRGSVEQVQVTGAKPRAALALLSRRGRVVATQRAGKLGGAIFRDVTPGRGYRVRVRGKRSRAVRVLSTSSAPPSTTIYRQKIAPRGYQYLTTRDGTKLAIDVRPPVGGGSGPVPTLVEYSGYGYARPQGGQSSIAQIANLLGYAVVDVNMRGTGCSGGAFDYFEPLQGLDGYDVIETIARQSWVARHEVGMMGISYGGISQLFVAATRPPSLAAITPLSVIDNTATTLYPGGILNTGFALSWAKERVHDAKPASATGGQEWALELIKGGDKVCRDNQVLHAQAPDLLQKIDDNNYYVPSVADPLAPVTFVDRIEVPVFLACQWTDEQTGGHCPTLAERFTGTQRKWFTFTNGTHIDSLDPATFNRWYDFLELYVAHRAPNLPAAAKGLAPTVFKAAMGVADVTLPPDPIQGRASYADALAAFQAQPPVRLLFDNGAGAAPAAPVPGFEQSFATWPLPNTAAKVWYLGTDGMLDDDPPAAGGADGFTANPKARPATSFTGDTGAGTNGLWTATPAYAWAQPPAGSALSYVSKPLSNTVVVVGGGQLDAWVKSSTPDVDLQVTISEVRPDGKETFVQNGWVRASLRKLDAAKSSTLEPVLSLRKADAAPMPSGDFAELHVPLYYQGHVYRAGSRVRVVVSAPGGEQPVWAFGETMPAGGTASVALAHAPDMPSRLVLPVVSGVDVPTPLPPCPGLRGEACRDYVALANAAG
jgi:predicted acyl esterase